MLILRPLKYVSADWPKTPLLNSVANPITRNQKARDNARLILDRLMGNLITRPFSSAPAQLANVPIG
jgi:hypothetical protein